MNFSSDGHRLPRINSDEAKDIVNRIPIFKNLIKPNSENKSASVFENKTMEGYLYLSRYNNSENHVQSKNLSIQLKTDEQSDNNRSHIESPIISSPVDHPAMSHKEQKRKFAISLATLSAKPHKRKTIIEDGGIITLSELVTIQDTVIRKYCSAAFALLSKEASLRSHMIEDGIISAIITFASSTSNRFIKSNCCAALCNIFCEPGSEAKAVREGVVQLLTRLASSYPENVENCLLAFLNLSCVSDKFFRIEELNESLFQFDETMLTEDKYKILLLSILCNLSALRSNQSKLVEDGCLRIVEWAWTSNNPEMRILGSDIIRNLTTEYRTRNKLVENNLVTMLHSMIIDPLEDVCLSAAKALYILSRDVSCRHKIMSGNEMKVLMTLSTRNFTNVDIGRTTIRVWRILSKDNNTKLKAINLGIVKAFLALLTTSKNDELIQQYMIETICILLSSVKDSNLSVQPAVVAVSTHNSISIIKELLSNGILTIIITLIQNFRSVITSECLAYSLYLLTNESIVLQDHDILKNGILPSLIKLCCSTISSDRAKCICSSSFVKLTIVSEIFDESKNSIQILVYLLKNEKNVLTRMNCSTALYNLSFSDDNCYKMLDAGVLLPVVELVAEDSSANSKCAAKCAAILSRLTIFEKYIYDIILENNYDVQILKVLLKLSIVDDIITQRQVVAALSNLTKDSQLRVKLLALNPIPYILSLTSKRDENLWLGCCSIICNLSFESGSELKIVQGGIVPTLLITALINTDSMVTKIICVKAIANLMTILPQELDNQDNDINNDYSFDENDVNNGLAEVKISDSVCSAEFEDDYSNDFDSQSQTNIDVVSAKSSKSNSKMGKSVKAKQNKPTSPAKLTLNAPLSLNSSHRSVNSSNLTSEQIDASKKIMSSMVSDGAIWGLSSLALLDNHDLLFICATTLYRLSVDFTKEIIESAVAVKALVLTLKQNSDVELLRLGGNILNNLLIQINSSSFGRTGGPRGHHTDVADPDIIKLGVNFRKHIVHHLELFTSSKDSDIMKSSIICLCLISECEPCRAVIVKDGLLHKIDNLILVSPSPNNKNSKKSKSSTDNFYMDSIHEVNEVQADQEYDFISKDEFLDHPDAITSNYYISTDMLIPDMGSHDKDMNSPKYTSIGDSDSVSNKFNESSLEDIKIISLAFLSLFNNLAKTSSIIVDLLNEEIIERFYQIIEIHDESLDIAAVHALYCLTCIKEYVEKIAKFQIIITIVNKVWNNQSYIKSDELIEYLVAILYNMSIHTPVQAGVVSQGIVKSLVSMWSYVSEKAKIFYIQHPRASIVPGLMSRSPSMLGNNNTNTSQFINVPGDSSYSNNSSSVNFNDINKRLSVYDISQSGMTSYNQNHAESVSTPSVASQANNPTVPPFASAVSFQNNQVSSQNQFMKLVVLISSAITHLGCGHVNSTKMIEDGCVPILVFITQCHKQFSFLQYEFNIDVYLRCSACFRNFLVNISNQEELIRFNCLYGLIDLFNLITEYDLGKSIPKHNANDVIQQLLMKKNDIYDIIRKNCASALRSLTFNVKERDMIIKSGGINVILFDLKHELRLSGNGGAYNSSTPTSSGTDDKSTDMSRPYIGNVLLSEIEAESWQNGLRKCQREERAKFIETALPCLQYRGRENRNISLNFQADTSAHVFYKYQSDIPHTPEVGNNTSTVAKVNSVVSKSIFLTDDSLPSLDIGLSDIVSVLDEEDHSHAIVQQCPKQECEVSEDILIEYLMSHREFDDEHHHSHAAGNLGNGNDDSLSSKPPSPNIPIIKPSSAGSVGNKIPSSGPLSNKTPTVTSSFKSPSVIGIAMNGFKSPTNLKSPTAKSPSVRSPKASFGYKDGNINELIFNNIIQQQSPKNKKKPKKVHKVSTQRSLDESIDSYFIDPDNVDNNEHLKKTVNSSKSILDLSKTSNRNPNIQNVKFKAIVSLINQSKEGGDSKGIEIALDEWKSMCGRK